MRDHYDEQIDRLMNASESAFQRMRSREWDIGVGLFAFANRTPAGPSHSYGCLTMIRASIGYHCEWPDLEERIRNDDRLPRKTDDIEQDRAMLEAFAEYQREMDRRAGV